MSHHVHKFDQCVVEMDKAELQSAGFGIEAAGFGGIATVYSIRGKPAVAVSWLDGCLAGFSVAKSFRRQGIATAFIRNLLVQENVLHIIDPNDRMLRLLRTISRVNEPSGSGIVTITS